MTSPGGTAPSSTGAFPESFLRLQLSRFLGLDEIEYMLDEWSGEADGRRALVAQTLPNKSARVRLTTVLRALVRGHIPIDDLGSILQAMELPSDGPSIDALVERTRSSLQRSFANLVDGRRRITVPESLEQALVELDVVRNSIGDRSGPARRDAGVHRRLPTG